MEVPDSKKPNDNPDPIDNSELKKIQEGINIFEKEQKRINKKLKDAAEELPAIKSSIVGEDSIDAKITSASTPIKNKLDSLHEAWLEHLKSQGSNDVKLLTQLENAPRGWLQRIWFMPLSVKIPAIFTLLLAAITIIQLALIREQTKNIKQQGTTQNYLLDLDRKSQYNVYIFEIIKQVNDELRIKEEQSPGQAHYDLSPQTIDLIISFTDLIHPYKENINSTRVQSKERGVILSFLLNSSISPESKEEIFGEINLNHAKIDSKTIRNKEIIGLRLDSLSAKTLTFKNCKLDHVAFKNPSIDKLEFINCKELFNYIEIIDGTIPEIKITGSDPTYFKVMESKVERAIVTKSKMSFTEVDNGGWAQGIQYWEFNQSDILTHLFNNFDFTNTPKLSFNRSLIQTNSIRGNCHRNDALNVNYSALISDQVLNNTCYGLFESQHSTLQFKGDTTDNKFRYYSLDSAEYKVINQDHDSIGYYKSLDEFIRLVIYD